MMSLGITCAMSACVVEALLSCRLAAVLEGGQASVVYSTTSQNETSGTK